MSESLGLSAWKGDMVVVGAVCVCGGGGGRGGGHRGEARIRTLVVVFLFEDIMVRA